MRVQTFDITIATAKDAQDLAFIHAESWSSAYLGILPGCALNRAISKRGPNWWKNSIEKGLRVLIIKFAGKTVGYATIGTSRVKWSVPAGEVYELYLLPVYQGLGLGRKLLKAASSKLQDLGYQAMLLWCLEENRAGCDFYEHVKGTAIAKAHEKFEGKKVLKTGFAWRL